ncbi:MAG TPA: hypothetical protein GXX75_05095 [Clostridiales bacterium]|nr:hypothetical protein [Clostridiales bacterium]
MKDYREQDWNFLNMNSPADLYAEMAPDGLHLCEYDRCRDGHALISRFYVNGEDASFQTRVSSLGAGVGIGLYFGDGCYRDYLLVTADKKGLSVRVPNGVPQGDTFRMEGAKRYYEIASKETCLEASFLIGFIKKKNKLTVLLNGSEVIRIRNLALPFQIRDTSARLIVKALNESGEKPKAESVFKGYLAEGIAGCYDFTGVCIDPVTKLGIPDVYVHAMGEFETWAKTDEEGRFVVKQLPLGSHSFVYGMEGKEFLAFDEIHDGSAKMIQLDFSDIESERENIPQKNLKSNQRFIGLNGIWRFDFDKYHAGEEERWYLKGKHEFSKCIRVPFSWQSLKAFGEEKLQDDYSLHQANAFTCTAKETGETGWYQRTVCLSEGEAANEVELVFAAISGLARVWLDGNQIGCTTDSYHPYAFPLGKLVPGREYVLTVKVEYEHGNHQACSGKQGFWFTDSPGIWQNVWLQEKRKLTVTDLFVNYDFISEEETKLGLHLEVSAAGSSCVNIKPVKNRIALRTEAPGYYKIIVDYVTEYETDCGILINGIATGMRLPFDAVHRDYYDKKEFYCSLEEGENEIEFAAEEPKFFIREAFAWKIELDKGFDLYIEDRKIARVLPEINQGTGKLEGKAAYILESTRRWTTKDPYQYQISARMGDGEDRIEFTRKLGIRKVGISSEDDLGGKYITINDRKTYIRGVMDQGYNPWGIYTYPKLRGRTPGSAEYDILAAEECGYNLIRMHIKDNETDWYDLCDEKGMLVWDETPSNFYGVAEDRHWQSMFRRELKQMIRKHNYHASVVLCSIFNESWGITGDHEKSPWDDPLGQNLIREYASYYKENQKQVLVIDNSGYGKTAQTQVIDHHAYPGGFEDAREFFGRLAEQNYKGSHFNFFHWKNRELLQNESIRDLLQRNCSQDLKNLNFTGEEVQNGQPVLISEFVHTDKQEELVRMFPKIAGYIRMNIASQENEDTSPFTAGRIRRDFGFVKEDFTKASYEMANSENLLYLDYPFLSKVQEREELSIPVYVSLWREGLSDREAVEIVWKFTGIDEQGYYKETPLQGMEQGTVETEKPLLFKTIEFKAPAGFKGGYLFVELLHGQEELACTYIQLEIFPEKKPVPECRIHRNSIELKPSDIVRREGFYYSGVYENQIRNAIWGYGRGSIVYELPCMAEGFEKAILVMEVSDCICIEGTRETDERLEDSFVELYIQEERIGTISIKGQSCDRRALFSNSGSGKERISRYAQTGTYGYGSRIEVELPDPVMMKIKRAGYVTVKLEASEKGITIYGNRMGSHGCNPMILLK